MKKLVLLSFVTLFLVSCTNTSTSQSVSESASDTSDTSEISVIPEGDIIDEKETFLYSPTLKEEQSSTAQYYDYALKEEAKLKYITLDGLGENRAYLSITSFIENYFIKNSYFESCVMTYENEVFTYTFDSAAYISFDTENNTIISNDIASIASKGIGHPLDISDVERYENLHTEITSFNTSSVESVTLDMGSHNLEIIHANSTVYLPTTVVGNLFLYVDAYTLTFNGTNFYLTNDPTSLRYNETSPNDFAQSYYETSTMRNLSTKTQAEANHDANLFLFYIDYYYGFLDSRGFKNGYGAYLNEKHPDIYENLFSTDMEKVMDAYDYIILTDMGDGHSNLFRVGSFYNEGNHTIEAKNSSRHLKLFDDRANFSAAREQTLGLESSSLGDKYLEFSSNGETAIIRFDSFIFSSVEANQAPEVYESHINDDNFSLFYTCFRKIEEKGTVKNVIVDVTCNGGGSSGALVADLGFIVDNPSMTHYDAVSKTRYTGLYRTDTNADGIIEAGESPANDYEMYVLTSPFSFSCGNAFPYFAKESGVKIIGAQSGGGQCCVAVSLLSDGYPIRLSGPFILARTENQFSTEDSGVQVDIEVPLSEDLTEHKYANFYKIDYLDTLIQQ